MDFTINLDNVTCTAREAVQTYLSGNVISGIANEIQLHEIIQYYKQLHGSVSYSAWGHPLNVVLNPGH